MRKLSTYLVGIVLMSGLIVAGYQHAFSQAKSQLSIGGSYETQSPHPNNGFGIYIENDLAVPLFALGIRARFNDFMEGEKFPGKGIGNHIGFDYHHRRYRYDLGLMALAKLRLGFLSPYVGGGIGTSRSSGNKLVQPPGLNNDHSNGNGSNGSSQGNGNDHTNNGNTNGHQGNDNSNSNANGASDVGNNNSSAHWNHGLSDDDAQGFNNGMYYQGTIGAALTLFPRLQPFVEYRFQKNSFREVVDSYTSLASNGIWSFGISLQI